MNPQESFEKNLRRYRILIACVPVPFEGSAVALNLEQAIRKVQFTAERCGLKPGKMIEYEEAPYQRKEAQS